MCFKILWYKKINVVLPFYVKKGFAYVCVQRSESIFIYCLNFGE